MQRKDLLASLPRPAQIEILDIPIKPFIVEPNPQFQLRICFARVLEEAFAVLRCGLGSGDLGVELGSDSGWNVDEGCTCVDCLRCQLESSPDGS